MIIVFGSINMDMVFSADTLPQEGETVICEDYDITSGGKGANQALAAARIGEKVALVGCVGNDGPALRMLRALRRDGVMTTGVSESQDFLTGCAAVTIDSKGQNQIVVAQGANQKATADQIPDEILLPKNVLLMQMELPAKENWTLIERAHERETKIILNLAPAIHIPAQYLSKLDYLIVNQIEARQISEMLGLDPEQDTSKIAYALAKQGELTCIITLGSQGATASDPGGQIIKVPALQLEDDQVVDTTGAGDAYCGTFAACIHKGLSIGAAMKRASIAGSLACLKYGAQDSFAFLGDIEKKLDDLDEITKEHI